VVWTLHGTNGLNTWSWYSQWYKVLTLYLELWFVTYTFNKYFVESSKCLPATLRTLVVGCKSFQHGQQAGLVQPAHGLVFGSTQIVPPMLAKATDTENMLVRPKWLTWKSLSPSVRVGNRQMNRQTEGHDHCVKPRFDLQHGLNANRASDPWQAGVKCEVRVCEVVKGEVRCEVGCNWSVASGSPRTLPKGN